MKVLSILVTASGLLSTTWGLPSSYPVQQKKASDPKIAKDFPDPTIIQDHDGTWYAFATQGNNVHIQAAKLEGTTWTWLNEDVLTNPGNWTSGADNWAPDVRRLSDGTYIMYYSAEQKNTSLHHCVGVATAKSILGPYTPRSTPFVCEADKGGAIDPMGFVDTDGSRYVVYKIDGNSIGNGGDCNNGIDPLVSTPLMLQQVSDDGFTKIGSAVAILDRTNADGPLVEAPALIRASPDGNYFLFYSSGCYISTSYDVAYATASNIKGPYTRASGPLIQTNDAFDFVSPGGATLASTGDNTAHMVFHANCAEGRCMFEMDMAFRGTSVCLNGATGIGC